MPYSLFMPARFIVNYSHAVAAIMRKLRILCNFASKYDILLLRKCLTLSEIANLQKVNTGHGTVHI